MKKVGNLVKRWQGLILEPVLKVMLGCVQGVLTQYFMIEHNLKDCCWDEQMAHTLS